MIYIFVHWYSIHDDIKFSSVLLYLPCCEHQTSSFSIVFRRHFFWTSGTARVIQHIPVLATYCITHFTEELQKAGILYIILLETSRYWHKDSGRSKIWQLKYIRPSILCWGICFYIGTSKTVTAILVLNWERIPKFCRYSKQCCLHFSTCNNYFWCDICTYQSAADHRTTKSTLQIRELC